MKFSAATIVAFGAVPASSLSYLDRIGGSAPVNPITSTQEPPFFFTNQADEGPADSPPFFFTTHDSSPMPTQELSGPGMTSYLDSVPQNPAVGGAGMSSYLDSV